MSHQGLASVNRSIGAAATAAGRQFSEVKLIAVSKTFGASYIEPIIGAGQRVFGENRVQEAKAKWPLLKERMPDLELHLIGPLQGNKAKDAVALFDGIHTIDRPKIADAVAHEIARQQRKLQLFIQINTGREKQKAGVDPNGADGFVDYCRSQAGLTIHGLMCIPPLAEEPRPHFELLRDIARRNGLEGLSMGMSADFVEAIACGATHVRIGSAVFGERTASLPG
jgi:PLP dependent protein